MRQILVKAKNGDVQAIMEVLEKCTPIISNTTMGIYIKGYEREDLYQIAVEESIKAIKNYNLEKYCGIASYLHRCIKNRLIDEIIKASRDIQCISLQDTLESQRELIERVEIDSVDIEMDYVDKDLKQKLRKIINKLSTEEKELIKKIYIEKKSINEYSKNIGKSWHTGNKMNKEVLKKILFELED